ncbi:MAG: hypothetical protein AB1810_01595 [Pseudomonadota bacterium]
MPLRKILLSALLIAGIVFAGTGLIDRAGEEYTDATLTRALVAFGVARALNGVISVAQGTEVAVEPGGIGVNFAPGEILDPINDLVERFSWVMLASSASVGIQKILLQISAWPVFTAGFVILLLAALALLWMPRPGGAGLRAWLLRMALVLLVARFCVPVLAIASEWVYGEFLAEEYEQASIKLEQTTVSIDRVNQAAEQESAAPQDRSLWETAKDYWQSASAALDITGRIEAYKQAAADISKHVINLIVIFLFQTILLPLGGLYLAYRLALRLWRVQYREHDRDHEAR